ncbi:MAG: transglutaminaseTgpA domain-containing protein [Phycisphaerales bacterium JB052]
MFWAIIGAVISFSVADANPVYMVLTLLSVLACWFGSVRPARPAPRVAINTVLLLVIAIAAVEILRVGVGVSAFAVFTALLLSVKLLDLRSARDDAQVLVLCLSVLVAAVLTSNNFITGLLMLIESVLLLRAFVLFQLHNVVSLGAQRRARITHATRVDVRSMLVATAFICTLIGGVIFVVLPRNIGGPGFDQWGASRSVSGFSDSVDLGRPGMISMSTKPVLDMTLTDRNGMNIGAENSTPIYLRGAVLEQYQQGKWRRGSPMDMPLAERTQLYQPNTTLKPRDSFDNSTWDMQCEMTMRSVNDGPVYLFAPWRPVEFRVGDRPMRIGFDFQPGLFLKDGIGGTINYTVRSVNDEFRSITVPEGTERGVVIPTQIEPEIAQLAREVVENGGIDPNPQTRPVRNDSGAIRLLETHLRTQYKYTLDAQPVPRGEDATKWFLFERRMGHCEYYASALTLMARAVGIPARVVTGYIASDFNPVTGQYIVRESNAHAWVEAEVAPGNWRTFDGTPPSDFHDIHVPDPGLMRSISRMYESIEYLWIRSVVGYDSDARERIMGNGIGDFGITRLTDNLLDRIAAGRAKLFSRATIVALIVFVLTLFLGIVVMRYQRVFVLFNQSWQRLIARFKAMLRIGVTHEQDSQRVEREIQLALTRVGAPRPSWQPLKTHLREISQQLSEKPDLQEALMRASEWVYQHRFSGVNNPDNAQMRGVIEAIRRSEKTPNTHSQHKS